MALSDVLIRGESAGVIAGLTLVSGEIDAVATAYPMTIIKNYQQIYADPDNPNSFVEYPAANGIKLQWPQVTTVWDGVNDVEKTSGSNQDKMTGTVAGLSTAAKAALIALLGKPVICYQPEGLKKDGTVGGHRYLVGVLTKFTPSQVQAETVIEYDYEVTGRAYTATGDGDDDLEWAPAAITPIGKSAFTPTPLVTGDVAALKAGKIVTK